MTVDFAALLGAVVIDSDNDTIVLTENTTDYNAVIASGTYYADGRGTSDDLALAIKTALDAAGANTYGVVISTFSRAPDEPCFICTISRTAGSEDFRIRWPSSSFDSALLGFANSERAAASTAETSAQSPTSLWVSPEIISDAPEGVSWQVTGNRLESGDTSIVRHSSRSRAIPSIDLPMTDERALLSSQEEVINRSLEEFLDENLDGRPVRFYRATLIDPGSSATLLDTVTNWDFVGVYRLGEGAAECLADMPRSQTGMPHRDLSIPLDTCSGEPDPVT